MSGDATATDADGDALTYTISTQPQSGTVDLNSSNGHFTYTSLSSSNTSKDSFVVAVTDGKTTAYMTVNVTINNSATAANVTTTVTNGQSTSGKISATDPDGDVLTYSIGSQGSKGNASINTETGEFTYRANLNASGADSFVVNVSDGINVTQVTVNVSINTTTMNISLTKGYVSSRQRKEGANIFLIDISAKAGNSGSPVIDMRTGKVAGILCGSLLNQNGTLTEEINYMRPLDYFFYTFVR